MPLPYTSKESFYISESLLNQRLMLAGCIGLSTLLAMGAIANKDKNIDLALIGSSATAALIGLTAGKSLIDADEWAIERKINEQLARQVEAFELPLAKEVVSLPAYDWSSVIRKVNDFPFLFLLGLQGAGKTVFAQYLQSISPKSVKLTINPHATSETFLLSDYRILIPKGVGVDDLLGSYYDGEERDDLTFFSYHDSPGLMAFAQGDGEIRCTIHQALVAVMREVAYRRYRCQQLGDKPDSFPLLDVYMDELPSIYSTVYANPPGTAEEKKKLQSFWMSLVKMLMMEARKYRVRGIGIVQAETIEAIGFKGLSALKKDYIHVYLGKTAIKLAAANKAIPREQVELMSSLQDSGQYRACLVDDQPVQPPSYDHMMATINGKLIERYTKQRTEFLKAKTAENRPRTEFQEFEPFEPYRTEPTNQKTAETLVNTDSSTKNQRTEPTNGSQFDSSTARTTQLQEKPSVSKEFDMVPSSIEPAPNPIGVSSNGARTKPTKQVTELNELIRLTVEGLKEGLSQSRIIKERWGYTSEAYAKGRNFWEPIYNEAKRIIEAEKN